MNGCYMSADWNFKTKEVEDAFNNVLDTFAAADGGKRFIYTKMLLAEMDKKAEEGDFHAEQILNVLLKFSHLINLANKD